MMIYIYFPHLPPPVRRFVKVTAIKERLIANNKVRLSLSLSRARALSLSPSLSLLVPDYLQEPIP